MKYANLINQLLDDDEAAFALARHKVSSNLEERLYATADANHNVTSVDDVFGAVKECQSIVLSTAEATTNDTLAWDRDVPAGAKHPPHITKEGEQL